MQYQKSLNEVFDFWDLPANDFDISMKKMNKNSISFSQNCTLFHIMVFSVYKVTKFLGNTNFCAKISNKYLG